MKQRDEDRRSKLNFLYFSAKELGLRLLIRAFSFFMFAFYDKSEPHFYNLVRKLMEMLSDMILDLYMLVI